MAIKPSGHHNAGYRYVPLLYLYIDFSWPDLPGEWSGLFGWEHT